MATVTKLKASVNNKNLPILGEDGNIYSYYLGRYSNKMSELGYSLTEGERMALNTFINNGIENGWIDKVPYFMPFIGNQTTPIQGAVPLIDNIADYELAVDSVGSVFSFENNKIKSFGGSSDLSGSIVLPITTFDFGISQSFAVFLNVNYLAANGDDAEAIKGQLAMAVDTQQVSRFAIRKGNGGSTPSSIIFMGKRAEEQSSITYSSVDGTHYYDDIQLGVFASIYKNDNSDYRKSYVINKGSNNPVISTPSITLLPTSKCTFVIGGGSRALTTAINCFALVKPQVITDADLYNFNQAVFALTTALGRDIPTT